MRYLIGYSESSIGFDPASKTKPRKEEIELACNLRSVLLHILRDVLQRVAFTIPNNEID